MKDEIISITLEVPGLPRNMLAWWNENTDVGVTEFLDSDLGSRQIIIGDIPWDVDLTEAENIAAAVEIVSNWLTVERVIDGAWRRFLKPEILGMRASDGCAVDCLAAIRAADVLLEYLRDISWGQMNEIRGIVAHQCEVFYFG